MNKRLEQFLAAENITQSQLADTIGVARAGVSHVLAGRNKPGYDFLLNIMNHYPDLNIEWLMTGKGKMYKSIQPVQSPSAQTPEPSAASISSLPTDDIGNLFSSLTSEGENASETPRELNIPEQTHTDDTNIKISKDISTILNTLQSPVKQRVVTKVVLFFDDNTFQEL
jgi:transcriptional regulator with XRE-family HTH domain